MAADWLAYTWAQLREAGIDEDLRSLADTAHSMLVRVSTQLGKPAVCGELLAMYATMRKGGYSVAESAATVARMPELMRRMEAIGDPPWE